MVSLLRKMIGDSSEKTAEKLIPIVNKINNLEDEIRGLADTELFAKTQQFKDRLGFGETLDDLLVEAYAVLRETARRTIGQRHYDAQLIGGIVLHNGQIAEMRTGEGKTLAATLPTYLNALTGKGVHVVTVNDYLSRRDPVWMRPIYHALG